MISEAIPTFWYSDVDMVPASADGLDRRCGPGRPGAISLENMVKRQHHACLNLICLIKKLNETQKLLSLTAVGNFIIMKCSKAAISLIARYLNQNLVIRRAALT